jgi:hypothetical protein
MSIHRNTYDPSPNYGGSVVRTWSHDYGGPEGLALFATVWVPERSAFSDYCYESGDHLWGGEAFVDALEDVVRRWGALSQEAQSPVPPTEQPRKGELLDRRYGT